MLHKNDKNKDDDNAMAWAYQLEPDPFVDDWLLQTTTTTTITTPTTGAAEEEEEQEEELEDSTSRMISDQC